MSEGESKDFKKLMISTDNLQMMMGKTIHSARGVTMENSARGEAFTRRGLKMAKSMAKFEITDKIYGQTPIKNTISNFYKPDEPLVL